MIAKVAKAFRVSSRDDLEAELARKLVALKSNLPTGIRDWKAYLAKFLYNKASNFARDERARQRRSGSFLADLTSGEDPEAVDWAGTPSERNDDRVALGQAWATLDPDLQAFWEILLEEGGNQLAVARRMRIHRNTVRLWRNRILVILKSHGFTN